MPKPRVPYRGRKAEGILADSWAKWSAAARLAESQRDLPEACFALSGVLHRAPSLPENIPSTTTVIKGYSTWKNPDASCSLTERKEKVKSLDLRRNFPTICRLSSNNFQVWGKDPNQGVGLLTLGWTYVLSAELAARQGLSMEYRVFLGPGRVATPTKIELDYAAPEEIEWWRAVGRPSGWIIEGDRISPWAVQIDEESIELEFTGSAVDAGTGQPFPPTAAVAALYLSRLCHAFGLGERQLTAALAAALAIGFNSDGRPPIFGPAKVDLPKPGLRVRVDGAKPAWPVGPPSNFALLGRYIPLSISLEIFGAALGGPFGNPSIPCNYAGAWLAPIVAILEPIVAGNQMERLVKVMAVVCPQIAPLWLGAALCGNQSRIRMIPACLKSPCNSIWDRPSVDSAAWTGVVQSFMDINPPGPRLGSDGRISRADVWRLRHACHKNYGRYEGPGLLMTPFYAWPPFGYMRAKDVELEIRDHLTCSHAWVYDFWTWLPSRQRDDGLAGSTTPPRPVVEPPSGVDELATVDDELATVGGEAVGDCEILVDMSKDATEGVFRWCSSQVEEGFGGTVVPIMGWSGGQPAKTSGEGTHKFDVEVVRRWLAGLEMAATEEDDRDPSQD